MNNSFKVAKLQAMKTYKKSQFLYNFILYSLTSLISCSFILYPFWLHFMNILSSVCLPNILSFFFTAKFLFLVGNVIVIILIKESKQASGSNSSPATEIYDKFVAQSHRCYMAASHSNFILAKKKVQEEKMENAEDKMFHADKKKEMKSCSGIVKREKREKEDGNYIPTEELNQRVEAYIARVNRQRLLEG